MRAMLRRDEWNVGEDGKRASDGDEKVTAGGESFWVLRVNLFAGPSWPVDCVTRLIIWERLDGMIEIEHGKFWPETDTTV